VKFKYSAVMPQRTQGALREFAAASKGVKATQARFRPRSCGAFNQGVGGNKDEGSKFQTERRGQQRRGGGFLRDEAGRHVGTLAFPPACPDASLSLK